MTKPTNEAQPIVPADVLIVGGGPAGLTAGWLLGQKTSLNIRILEQNRDYVGGISRTENYKGYFFDIGGHRFFTKAKEVQDLWDEILPNDFILRPRKSRIFYQGKFFHYPLRAFDAVSKLGFFQSSACILSYVWARIFPVRHVKSFHDWVRNQFGERLFQIFFKSYTEKVWGMSCDDLSADWAAQRIKGLNLFNLVISSIRKSLGLQKSEGRIKTLIEQFRYPRQGPGMLWTAAARGIKERGGHIDMGITAKSFVWNAADQTWLTSAVDQSGTTHQYRSKHIISSAPLRETIPSISPRPQCTDQVKTLKYRDFITVALMINALPTFDDNWIYIHDSHVHVGRIQNYRSWSPDMVPEGDTACFGLEFFCDENDALSTQNDADLIALAKQEIVYLGLCKSDQITDGYVVRQPKAYPVYDDQYSTITDALRREFAVNYPTFHMVGRNGMHKYNNQDHAMMTAMLTVQNIIAQKNIYDVWAVNIDAEYHEEQKLSDAS